VAVAPHAQNPSPDAESDARLLLAWLRARYAGGRAPMYPPLRLCREVFGQQQQCDPISWSRLWRALPILLERGEVEETQLPQGDPGIRLSPRGAQGG
jgi:hypothetical protein